MDRIRSTVVTGVILAATTSRRIAHSASFAPIGGPPSSRVLVSAASAAFLLLLTAMLVSDLPIGLVSGDPSLGFHGLIPVVCGGFALIVRLGFWLRRRRNAMPIAGATAASPITPFVLTNFGVWAFGPWYRKTWDERVACFAATIPLLHNALLGKDFCVPVLFGGLALAEKRRPVLRECKFALQVGSSR